MTVNNTQIGGDHYKSQFQHWDFIVDNGIGYLEGCASKYVTRWKKKNGVQDVEKAIHYVQKLLERASVPGVGHNSKVLTFTGWAVQADITDFCTANDLGTLEESILQDLCGPWDVNALTRALWSLNTLLKQATLLHAGQTGTGDA